MRRVLGVAVFSGMIGVTVFGIFLTPVFFYVIEGFVEQPLFSSARARQIGDNLVVDAARLVGGDRPAPQRVGAAAFVHQRRRRHRPAVADVGDEELGSTLASVKNTWLNEA